VGRKWHWVNVLRMSDEELAEAIHAPDRDIRVLYLDGAPAGFFDLKPHLPGEVELAYFGMMEHAIGQGIGRWFLGAAVEAAWSYNPKVVTVQTCTLDHPAALPLYQRLGFSPVGQKQEKVMPMSFADRCASVMRP
jgi:GNAT superfamily N-acetyltransferase